MLVFDIHLDNGLAGLGVTVHGRCSSKREHSDMGIYIKSIVPGGAAARVSTIPPSLFPSFPLSLSLSHTYCLLLLLLVLLSIVCYFLSLSLSLSLLLGWSSKG